MLQFIRLKREITFLGRPIEPEKKVILVLIRRYTSIFIECYISIFSCSLLFCCYLKIGLWTSNVIMLYFKSEFH